MDIKEKLLSGHSKKLTEEIVAYIGNDSKKFRILISIFFEGPYRLTQRSAWSLAIAAENNPLLVKPYFKKLVEMLQDNSQHPAVARNILRIFQDIEIPEEFHSVLVDICFGHISNETSPVAVRAFAISTALSICSKYPELRKEMLIILKELEPMSHKPAIRQRLKLALKQLGSGISSH
jgi:hypothetical protein